MLKRTPLVAFIIVGLFVGAFGQAAVAGTAGGAAGVFIGVSIVALAVFRTAYGRTPFRKPTADD